MIGNGYAILSRKVGVRFENPGYGYNRGSLFPAKNDDISGIGFRANTGALFVTATEKLTSVSG